MTDHRQYSVLVADDDEACRESLRDLLHDEGLRTFAAGCGIQALEYVQERLIDMVILDLYMPDITGIETLRRIVEIKKNMPSIIISGEHTKEMKMEALNAGAFTFISKPIQTAIMRHAVHQMIDRYYAGTRRRE